MVNAREAKCPQLGNIGEIFWDCKPLFGRECQGAAFSSSKTLSDLSVYIIWADGMHFMQTSSCWTVWSFCSMSQYFVLSASKTYQVFPTHQERLSSMCQDQLCWNQEDQETNSRKTLSSELQAKSPRMRKTRFWHQKNLGRCPDAKNCRPRLWSAASICHYLSITKPLWPKERSPRREVQCEETKTYSCQRACKRRQAKTKNLKT